MLDSSSRRSGPRSHWSVPSASWWVLRGRQEVLSRFRVPSWLPLLSCHVGSSWFGQSVPIVQQVCADHELTLPHQSLIPPLLYMSLCFYYSLGVDCFVLACVWTVTVPYLSLCPLVRQNWKHGDPAARVARRLCRSALESRRPKQPWNSLCYFVFCDENKVSPSPTLCIWVLQHPHLDTNDS